MYSGTRMNAITLLNGLTCLADVFFYLIWANGTLIFTEKERERKCSRGGSG